MSFNVNSLFETTAVRNVVRTAVAGVVGSLVAWGTTKWASLSTGNLSYLVPVFTTAYFGLVHLLEKKYPKLGWLLGLLPKSTKVVTSVVVPTPEPTPAPTPAVKVNATKATDLAKKQVAKKATAVKKAAPKKK